MKKTKLIGFIAVLAVIAFAALSLTGCDDDGNKKAPPGKQAGASVSIPVLISKNSNSITVNAATFPSGNPGGQTIEYGRNTVNTAPSDGWQDGTTFTGLSVNTAYYIFARSKENAGYHAGQPSAGLSVTTDSSKQAGAAVSIPVLISKNSNSITVNAATFPSGNPGGQTIEYGRNTVNTAPASWQDDTTFTGLSANTAYYIFARSKENATHSAGLPSIGQPVTTDPELDPNRVSMPTTNIPAGNVPIGTEILLTTTTVGATIYYTTDGSDPTESSSVFSSSSPIIISAINVPMTIKAIAAAQGRTNSTVMTAIYTPIYTVTFNSNSGSAVSPILNVEHGSTINEPPPPTRTNHQFDGWYKNTGLTTVWDFAVDTVTSTTVLYAKWLFTVTFDSRGGTAVSPIQNIEPGSTITTPQQPTRADYEFGGWYTSTSFTTIWDFAVDTVTSSRTLYVKWINPSLTYNIGDTGPGGGKIFYRDEEGFTVQGYGNAGNPGYFASYTAHYLEVAPSSSGTAPWGAYETYISGLSTLLGTGRRNTQTIAAYFANTTETNRAAQIAAAATFGDKNDWFLPSYRELDLLSSNRSLAGITIANNRLWSSSQMNSDDAYQINFGIDSRYGVPFPPEYKGYQYLVYAIRAF